MNRRFVFGSDRLSRFLIVFGFAAAVGACSEKLEGGASCPVLCPQQQIDLKDTLIEPVIVDSTRADFSPIGEESELLLTARGDTFETRVVMRFDSLPRFYFKPAAPNDTVFITAADSARLRVRLDTVTLSEGIGSPTAPVTVEAYDVDAIADTTTADLLPLFTSARLLGSKTFAPESLKDTLEIPIASATVANRITQRTHLRLGLKLVSGKSAQLRLLTNAATVLFKPAADTTLSASLLSATPPDSALATLRANLADFVIVARGNDPLPPATIGIGGYPARRTYMRFSLPSHIVDSSTVVRASLILTQVPRAHSPGAADSITILPLAVTAAPSLTDVSRLLNLGSRLGITDSLRVRPLDGGVRRFELVSLVRVWKLTKAEETQRALVLVSRNEGTNVSEAVFYSSEADPSLRPKLQLVYAPRFSQGLP